MEKSDCTQSRIKKLISKTAKTEIEKAKKARDYKQEKNPPLPSGIENISVYDAPHKKRSLGKVKVIPQKVPNSALEQMHCNQNQNYPLFFIEKAEALQMKRVQNFKVKERLIAARNLKKLSHQMQKWMHQEVKILGESSQEFYDLIQKREERHFQIDRIIRYLSDT